MMEINCNIEEVEFFEISDEYLELSSGAIEAQGGASVYAGACTNKGFGCS